MKSGKKKKQTIETIIGRHAYFEGTLCSEQGIRIDGRVKGKVECEGSLVIGNEGKVEGEIVADDVFIAGELTGTATAKNHVEITEKGKVYGDITTRNLIVDQGVIFEGKCHMTSEEEILDPSDPLSLPTPFAASPSGAGS